ncbi:hypothetical protein ACFRCW_42580 [Streptomyces sp. NPDC056653]|uniref:hypothetical protein n=1 Tax=Streptomyces sp. NPDC056653 TaxID=3345894 RepID=UPI0036C1EB57
MTRAGNDGLKREARVLARKANRRYPDVLTELRDRRPSTSTELVLVCPSPSQPLDPGRCARPAGHHHLDGSLTWPCSHDPHHPSHVWDGYYQAADQAQHTDHERWLAALSPAEREAYEDQQAMETEAAMAEAGAEVYDPAGQYLEYVRDAADKEYWAAEAAEEARIDGYLADDNYFGYSASDT